MLYEVSINGHEYSLELLPGEGAGDWLCRVQTPGSNETREIRLNAAVAGSAVISLVVNGRAHAFKRDPTGVALVLAGKRYEVEVRDPRSPRSRQAAKAAAGEGERRITAPMPGKVVRILLQEGAQVEAGEGVLVVEAMKMQNELKSPKKGVLKKLVAREGAAVNAGETLAIVE